MRIGMLGRPTMLRPELRVLFLQTGILLQRLLQEYFELHALVVAVHEHDKLRFIEIRSTFRG